MTSVTKFQQVLIFLILMFSVLVVFVMSLISGSSPPSGMGACLYINTGPQFNTKNFNLNAKSVLSDSVFVQQSCSQTDNFKNIGIWNLLDGLVIGQGSYNFNTSGKIFLSTDYLDINLSYDKAANNAKYVINNLNAGDFIGLFVQNNPCLQAPSGSLLCNGQNIEIYNNSAKIKDYNTSFSQLSGLKVNGPEILAKYGSVSPGNVSSLASSFLASSYDLLPIVVNSSGSLNLNLYQGENNTATGTYILSALRLSNSVTNGVSKGRGQVQLALRNDNDPATWVSGGVDNTPLDEVIAMNSNSLNSYANTEYSRIWARILDDDYTDNVGDYLISFSQAAPTSDSFSSFINGIYQTYYTSLMEATGQIYIKIIASVNVAGVGSINLIQLLSMLYVIVYGIYFTLGLTKKSQEEFIGLIIKLALVNVAFSEQSWIFFSKFFFDVFLQGPFYLINEISANSSSANVISGNDISNQFVFIDRMLTIFYSKEMLMTILGFLVSPPIGWVISYSLIHVIFSYTLLILDVIAQFFTSVITTSLMIAAFPVFIALIFFGVTKDMISKVISVLAEVYLRVFFLFSGLAILQELIWVFFGNLNGFNVCWDVLFDVYGFFTMYAYRVNIDSNLAFKVMQNIVCFHVICSLCKSFIQTATRFSSNVTGAYDVFFQDNRAGGGGSMVSAKVGKLAQSMGFKASDKDKSEMRRKALSSSVNRHIDKNRKPEANPDEPRN